MLLLKVEALLAKPSPVEVEEVLVSGPVVLSDPVVAEPVGPSVVVELVPSPHP